MDYFLVAICLFHSLYNINYFTIVYYRIFIGFVYISDNFACKWFALKQNSLSFIIIFYFAYRHLSIYGAQNEALLEVSGVIL